MSNREFKAEVKEILHLVIHSLYTKKEIAIRELISNASDALDRARYESLTNPAIFPDHEELRIRIIPDTQNKILIIEDNGIGMSAEELEKNIGTIASSGTRQFFESIAGKTDSQISEFIGQFGVGFYSAFMIAKRVELRTKRRGGDGSAWLWTSEGEGFYTIEPTHKERYGTEIRLILRDQMEEFLEEWKIRKIVKQYSDFIHYPIYLQVRTQTSSGDKKEEKIEEVVINSQKAIWRKSPNEVKEDEYKEFYQHISHDPHEPLKWIHYRAEGTLEFFSLLYIPGQIPFDLFAPERKHGIHLYVKNVFIMDNCEELLPEYLRFLRGIVDSSDLPLNVSREMLQDEAIVRKIRKNLTSKILNVLKEMKEKESSKYETFWKNFGKVLKEGIHLDFENRERLQELLLFPSMKALEKQGSLSGADQNQAPSSSIYISLETYVQNMPSHQKAIYYVTGFNLSQLQHSPYIEFCRQQGYDVLLLVDPVDEFVIPALPEYKGHKLQALDRGEIQWDGTPQSESKQDKEALEKEYQGLLSFIQKELEDHIKNVKLSHRLVDSPCCLVADEHGLSAHMEQLLKAMGKEYQPMRKNLEVNPHHPLLKKMLSLYQKSSNDSRLKDYSFLLLNQALLAEGSPLKDQHRFMTLVTQLMTDSLVGD